MSDDATTPATTPDATASDSLTDTAKLTAGLDKLAMLAEATAGYRAKLISGGIGPEVADAMAAEYHSALMEVVTTQMKAQTAMQIELLQRAAAARGGSGGLIKRPR